MKTKEKKDVIQQDLKIAQQFMQHLAGGKERVQFNVFNVGQIKVDQSANHGDLRERLEFILERLPEPRMKSLIALAYEVAINKAATITSGANWLGVCRRTIENKKLQIELEESENE